MKKTLLISALCALILCSCSKSDDENNANSFGRAEILFELAGPDYQGTPASDILEYFSFNVTGTDFNGAKVSQEITMDSPKAVIVCDKAPTEDKSLFASLGLDVSKKKQIPAGSYSIGYSLNVHFVIYDKNGNELTTGFITRTSSKGASLSEDLFEEEITDNNFSCELELCYTQRFMSDEWMYNIAVKQN